MPAAIGRNDKLVAKGKAMGVAYAVGGVPMKSAGKGYANYELPVHRDAKIFQLSQTNANR